MVKKSIVIHFLFKGGSVTIFRDFPWLFLLREQKLVIAHASVADIGPESLAGHTDSLSAYAGCMQ